MSIVTFYSYKGGVGRSMALANVAFELSRKGLNILMIDWDLEAPGLEKYFMNFEIEDEGLGLLPMLLQVKNGFKPNYKKFLWKIKIPSQIPISFLHSGREKDTEYTKKLESFAWDEFFSLHKGGEFLEEIREKWKADYDLILIDSRTGLSDASGICTILLPDVIVPMFTANFQSLNGIRDVVKLAQEARQKLDVFRTPFSILPVPARFGTRAEFKESQEWLDRFDDSIGEFYSDWLPIWIKPKQVLERIKIPQVDYFSYGEKLAVVEHGTSDPEGMGFIYSKIASLLASDLKDLESFIGEDFKQQKEMYEQQKKKNNLNKTLPSSNYHYDIFISYRRSSISNHWIREIFLPSFKVFLEEELGRKVKIFFDSSEIQIGDYWVQEMSDALISSKILIPILTANYFKNKWLLTDLLTFNERSKEANLIFPICVGGLEVVQKYSFLNVQMWDFMKYYTASNYFNRSSLFIEFQSEIIKLAKQVSESLKNTPSFDKEWKLIDSEKVDEILQMQQDDFDLPKM